MKIKPIAIVILLGVAAAAASAQVSGKLLYTFTNSPDGAHPLSALVFDKAGNLYGNTSIGGTGTNPDCGGVGCGIIFELSPNGSGGWNESVIYDFQGGNDGDIPSGALIFDNQGNLYGTTEVGGTGCQSIGSCGTVFELSPNGSGGWNESVLYSFQGGQDGKKF